MIVTKTPLRISFFGGGSDIPEFYEKNDGMVLSTTINSYIYLAVNRCVAPHLKVIYSQLELENDVEQIKHDRVREALKHFGLTSNMEICSFSDVPTKGTGLGSSSTFTVGLVNALYNVKNKVSLSAKMMAETASYIEINCCKEPIGKQDQYAAAYGGFNIFEFNKYDVSQRVMKMSFETKQTLNDRLMLFNTKQTRLASSVLTEQVDNLKKNINVDLTKTMVEMTKQAIGFLQKKKLNDFGILLDDAWQIKKRLSTGISTERIDSMYETAIANGALGGKILGAGGGGYLLMYVPEENQNKVREALKEFELLDFEFTNEGSTVEMHTWN